MLRNIFRELFGTEFGSDVLVEDVRKVADRNDDNDVVMFPLETGEDDKENNVIEREDEEYSLEIGRDSLLKTTNVEFPEPVDLIDPLDTNFLQEEGSGLGNRNQK